MAMDLGLQKEMSPLTENFTDFRWPYFLKPFSHWRQVGRWMVCQRQKKHGKQGRLPEQSVPTAEFLVRSTIFSLNLSPHPPHALISFSALCSPTPLAHVSPSMWMTKFPTHKTALFIVAVNCNVKWLVSHRRWAMQLLTVVATILTVVKPRTSSHFS